MTTEKKARHLYDENYKYTPEASTLDLAVVNSMMKLMEQYADKGFSPREIAVIMHLAVTECECEMILRLDSK